MYYLSNWRDAYLSNNIHVLPHDIEIIVDILFQLNILLIYSFAIVIKITKHHHYHHKHHGLTKLVA